MPWRYFGRAKADPSNPEAAGICQRCDFTYQLRELVWQYEYRGTNLQNTWFRVCRTCLDKPAPFLRAIVLPADPVPVPYPRPNTFPTQMNAGNPASVWDTADASWDSDQGSGNPTYWDGA